MEINDLFEDEELGENFTQSFDELDRLEVIQLLSDLGYIPQSAFEDGRIDDSELIAGGKLFKSELQEMIGQSHSSNLMEVVRSTNAIEGSQSSGIGNLTLSEIYILKDITGLDQELHIYHVEEGISNLFTRVLLYRYRVFGLTAATASDSLDGTVIDDIKSSVKEFGFQGGWIDFSNLLSNQERLSRYCADSEFFHRQLEGSCIFFPVISKEGRDVISDLGGKIRKKARFLKEFGESPFKVIPERLLQLNDHTAISNQVRNFLNSRKNRFMLRVLQVKLWVLGLYQGDLDHNFGPESILALRDLLLSIIENDEDGKKELGKVLYDLGTDQCILSIKYLIKEHLLPMELSELKIEQSSVSKVYEFVLEDKSNVANLSDDQKAIIKFESEQLNTKLGNQLRTESQIVLDSGKKNKRQYKGKKGILKFISKFWKWLKNSFKKIIKLIKRLLSILAKAVKFIIREVQEAFQQFKRGLKFLFGKRIVNPTKSIKTDFDFDFDSVTSIKMNVSVEEIRTHITDLRQYSQAVYPTLNFTRIVIQWGIRFASGPVGWVKILIGIAKLFKEFLAEKSSFSIA